MVDEEKLKGMKMHYDALKNEYLIDTELEVYKTRNFGSEFTIPFMKIE